MQITIFGTGYVGLVTGTCLAEVGHEVICVDIDSAKIDGLNRGIVPIYEPGLEPMVKANHAAGRLRFTTNAIEAIPHGEVIFITVTARRAESDVAIHKMPHKAKAFADALGKRKGSLSSKDTLGGQDQPIHILFISGAGDTDTNAEKAIIIQLITAASQAT